MNKTKVAVIGGGTGTVAVLTGLKKYDDLQLSVIVSMTDDGGSNAVVRDQFGLLPLSDIRKSIIALSDVKNGILREVFTYRFAKGDGLSGHTLGNLIMMALSDIGGSEMDAIKEAKKLFNVKGEIIPVTLDDVRLAARYSDGSIIMSEHMIDEPELDLQKQSRIAKLFTQPTAKATTEAVDAILEADYIIAGPGDLYTSTLANIVVEGIPEAIAKSKGKFVFITNLMTKVGQTHEMTVKELVEEITKYANRMPDMVVINNKTDYPKEALEKYKGYNEYPIKDDTKDEKYELIKADVVLEENVEPDKGDTLVRSLIRHDSAKLAKILYDRVIKD